MDIVDMAIHQFVCQKSDFHGNCNFQNSQKLDPLQKAAKNFWPKYASLSKMFRVMVHYKSRIRYTYVIWFV
jgi:hypothetical protein